MILSYILHGHVPTYDPLHSHPDHILHDKLKGNYDLLNADVDLLTEHFSASRFSYSTQALPVNVLLDTLIRPLGETDDSEKRTCIKWEHDASRAVSHVVVGNTSAAGGQWVDNPVKASWDIATLSYAGMLSLPGYSFEDFYHETKGLPLPFYLRPTRRKVTDYLAKYPTKVGIEDSIFCGYTLSGISRTEAGFHIASHDIRCKHLVLASGIFTELIPPRPLLRPLLSLPAPQTEAHQYPTLVVGSGFSAADIIISAPAKQKLLHIYKWAPSTSPSPLRACHKQAYPEYAAVYRRMKVATLASRQSKDKRPRAKRAQSSAFDLGRDWDSDYEGLPNTAIVAVRVENDHAIVTLQNGDGPPFERRISSLAYVVGRRGSLSYLDPHLQKEICCELEYGSMLQGQTLREKACENLEMTKDVFIVGSLTGDSLIRFSYGGCAYAAGRIMKRQSNPLVDHDNDDNSSRCAKCGNRSSTHLPVVPIMNGLDGHGYDGNSVANGHMPLDRRKDGY